VEAPVRQVEVPVLELDELPGEGGHPHQQVQHDARVAVVGGVVVGSQDPRQARPLLLQYAIGRLVAFNVLLVLDSNRSSEQDKIA